jgi:hypothetical protein
MTLEGAINLNETNDYIIYTMNSVTSGQYGVVIPKNTNLTMNMLVDLHMKGSFDGVGIGVKTREQLVDEISDEYNKLKTRYSNGMLVMPMIDEVNFQGTVTNGDKQKMFDEVKKIGAITSELYKKLTESGVDKQKIDQKIIIVEKKQEDEKFVAWLKEQMPNFVDGVLYNELIATQPLENPFVSNNIFGPVQEIASKTVEPAVSEQTSVGGIFDNVTTVSSINPVVEPVSPSIPVAPVVSAPVESVPLTTETPINPVSNSNVDLFGTSTNVQNVGTASAPVVNSVSQNTVTEVSAASVQPAAPVQSSVIEGPKPVESANLEGTTSFAPITDNITANNEESNPSGKGSKGFVNLIILLVVLVGVTLVSIELGKYLYSVYGA